MPTKIEWVARSGTTPESWNPVTGCTKISEGCRNCYAERLARRLAGRFGYPEVPYHFDVTLHRDRLEVPLRWRKKRTVFVCSMGDLFHERVLPWVHVSVWQTMWKTPDHTYLILTKRAERMQKRVSTLVEMLGVLPNVWLGVSIESQDKVWQIKYLMETSAVIRFLSLEPLLSKISLENYLGIFTDCSYSPHQELRIGASLVPNLFTCRAKPSGSVLYKKQLDWVILGGESGTGARPMHPDWARSVRDQCQEAGVPFFYKQTGEWIDAESLIMAGLNPYSSNYPEITIDGMSFFRVGKKRAGRLLDGREWNEWPTVG